MASELELDALAERDCLVAHLVADRHRAGERDRLDPGMVDQGRSDFCATPDDDVENARWKSGLVQTSRQVQCTRRRLGRCLQHHAVSVGERGRGLPQWDREREVPGTDQTDHTDWTAQHLDLVARRSLGEDLALGSPSLAGVEAQLLGPAGDFGIRLADRLAHLACHVSGDLRRPATGLRRQPGTGSRRVAEAAAPPTRGARRSPPGQRHRHLGARTPGTRPPHPLSGTDCVSRRCAHRHCRATPPR